MQRRHFISFVVTAVSFFKGSPFLYAATTKEQSLKSSSSSSIGEPIDKLIMLLNIENSVDNVIQKNLDALNIELKKEYYSSDDQYKAAISSQKKSAETFVNYRPRLKKYIMDQMKTQISSEFSASEVLELIKHLESPLSKRLTKLLSSTNSNFNQLLEYPSKYVKVLIDNDIKAQVELQKQQTSVKKHK